MSCECCARYKSDYHVNLASTPRKDYSWKLNWERKKLSVKDSLKVETSDAPS